MPRYNFKCVSSKNHVIEVDMSYDDMKRTKLDEIKVSCPTCGSKCKRTVAGMRTFGHVRGDGYKDKVGVQRDVNKFTIQKNDPYGYMRDADDKEQLLKKLGYSMEAGSAELENITYKVCNSCCETLNTELFEEGTSGRCVNCTPLNERREKLKTKRQRDEELYLYLNSEDYKEKKLEESKSKFKEEFGFDVDDAIEAD